LTQKEGKEMKRALDRAFIYPDKIRREVIHAVLYGGKSITEVCYYYNIADTWQARGWIRAYRKEKGITVMPKRLKWKHTFFHLDLPDEVNKEIQRLEEINIYLESMVEALFHEGDEEIKKKLLGMLSPSQRRSLKQKGKL
jgi:transposase-like protein